MKNLGQFMRQAQEMQNKIAQMQEELLQRTVEGKAGGGMVTIEINGKGDFKNIKIDPTLLKPEEGEILEDLIKAAFNDAKTKADQQASEEMERLTGGLKLPGGMRLPF